MVKSDKKHSPFGIYDDEIQYIGRQFNLRVLVIHQPPTSVLVKRTAHDNAGTERKKGK